MKDIAYLHSLLWYVSEYREMRSDTLSWLADSDLEQLQNYVDEGMYADAAQLLQIDVQLVQDSIEQLIL